VEWSGNVAAMNKGIAEDNERKKRKESQKKERKKETKTQIKNGNQKRGRRNGSNLRKDNSFLSMLQQRVFFRRAKKGTQGPTQHMYAGKGKGKSEKEKRKKGNYSKTHLNRRWEGIEKYEREEGTQGKIRVRRTCICWTRQGR
jgi:hypothetical protein